MNTTSEYVAAVLALLIVGGLLGALFAGWRMQVRMARLVLDREHAGVCPLCGATPADA